jgi:hypothetical protein
MLRKCAHSLTIISLFNLVLLISSIIISFIRGGDKALSIRSAGVCALYQYNYHHKSLIRVTASYTSEVTV